MPRTTQSPQITRRTALGVTGLCGASFIFGSESALAQAKAPSGPVEITTGTSAGGTPDVLMRRAAKILNEEKIVTNPLAVQNRTGGSWQVAFNYVLNRKGDDNIVLCIAQPIFTTPITQGQATVHDKVTPISMFIQGDLVVAVQPNSPVKDLKEFISLAKERERGIKVAGASAGSTDHMVTGLIEKAGGVRLNFIPFDGGGAAQAAFLGGNVDMVVLSLSEALPLMQAQKIKPIAVLSEVRRTEPEFKDLPTAREQGYEIVWGQAWGLAGPPDMDPALVKFWDDAVQRLVATDGWKSAVREMFLRSEVVPANRMKEHLQMLYDRHLAVLRDIGLAKL
jgi:putative tricarboxylic transport membrane protein